MDANLQKIIARYYFGDRSEIISEKMIQQLQTQLQNEHISGRAINNALMDFGALVSTSWDKLDKENYPIRDCRWFQTE
jgi:adenine-specific DNA glycosylase